MTFRLKYLFCLILIAGIALMWGTWYSALRAPSANQLLSAQRRSEEIPPHLEMLLAAEHLGLGEWEKFVSTGGRASESSLYSNVVYEVEVDWLPEFGYEVFTYKKDQTECAVYWTVDWPAVEAKARDENWAFNRRVIISVLSLLVLGWVFWPRRLSQKNSRQEN